MMTHAEMVKRCMDDLWKLRGLPPHDGPSNFIRSDGYFSEQINRTYTPEVRRDANKVIDEAEHAWGQLRERFIVKYVR